MKKRTTISIEDDLLTEIKILAVKKKCTIGDIIEKGVNLYLEMENKKLSKEGDKKN